MPSYGNVSFNVLAKQEDNELVIPDSIVDSGVVETKIPYADVALLQYTGRSNEHLTFDIEINSDQDYLLMKSYVGDATGRELDNPFAVGLSYAVAYLTKMTGKRVTYRETWYAQVEFSLVAP